MPFVEAGGEVFGFSTFCACTRTETCQSANAEIIASAKTRMVCRDVLVFMAYSRMESFVGPAKHTATRPKSKEQKPGAKGKGKGVKEQLCSATSPFLLTLSLFALPLLFHLALCYAGGVNKRTIVNLNLNDSFFWRL